ncbi:MAG: hypothetical protein RLZ14_2278, partial [Actinomycetota bacterium]
VRTGRHFVGYDTDAAYAAAAMERVAAEQRLPQVRLAATDTRHTDPLEGGWAAKDLAERTLADAGFSAITDDGKLVPGVAPTLSAVDRAGRRWWFEVVGGRTSNRPGAQRIELLWRAIAKAAVAREADPASRFGVLTVGLPAAQAGGKALAAVTGEGKAVTVMVDLLAPDALTALAAHAG